MQPQTRFPMRYSASQSIKRGLTALMLMIVISGPLAGEDTSAKSERGAEPARKKVVRKKVKSMSREDSGKLSAQIEVHYVERICHPSAEQLRKLQELADKSRKQIEDAKNKEAEEHARKSDRKPLLPAYVQDFEYQRGIRKALSQSAKDTLTADQLARYRADCEARESFRRNMQARQTVVFLDQQLVLSAEQRDSLESLLTNSKNGFQYDSSKDRNSQLLSKIGDQAIDPLLDELQRTVWKEQMKLHWDYPDAYDKFDAFQKQARSERDADGKATREKDASVSLPDDIFDGLVFQADRNAAGARRRLERHLELELTEINRICKLTDSQKSDLGKRMAAEFNQRFEQVEARRKAYKSVSPLALFRIYGDRETKYDRLLFGEVSYLAKFLKKTLTPQQDAAYQKVIKERRSYCFRGLFDQSMAGFDDALGLDAEQHAAFYKLLSENTKIPEKFRHNYADDLALSRQVKKIANETFDIILDPPQLARLNDDLSPKEGSVDGSAISLAAELNEEAALESDSSSRKERPSDRIAQPAVPALVKQGLGWLPVETETVIATQSFTMPEFTLDDFQGGGDFKLQLQQLPLLDLVALEKGKYLQPFVGKRIALALRGGRNFELVTKFGGHRSEGCTILVFAEDLGKTKAEWTELLQRGKSEVRKIEGQEVFVFPIALPMSNLFPPEKWQGTYLVVLSPNIVLCASSDRYLEDLLKCVNAKPEKRALPDNLPIWNRVDTSAPAWMVRQIPVAQKDRLVDAVSWTSTDDWFQAVYIPVRGATEKVQKEVQNRWNPAPNQAEPDVERLADGTIVFSKPIDQLTPIGPLGMHWWVYVLQAENGNVGTQ